MKSREVVSRLPEALAASFLTALTTLLLWAGVNSFTGQAARDHLEATRCHHAAILNAIKEVDPSISVPRFNLDGLDCNKYITEELTGGE